LPLNLSLNDAVQFVPGVGPGRAKAFAKLGIKTVEDLIEHFPTRYDLTPKSTPIEDIEEGEVVTLVGEIRRLRSRGSLTKQRITANLVDGTGQCRIQWFHSSYLLDKLHEGQIVRLTGKVVVQEDKAKLTNPSCQVVEEGQDALDVDEDLLSPVYAATQQLTSAQIERIIANIIDEIATLITEFLPPALQKRRNLPARRLAILRYHKPLSQTDLEVSRHRIAYDEFLLCQIAVQMGRARARQSRGATPLTRTEAIDARIRKRLPFKLTPGQDKVIVEICADLARDVSMSRLLQADVGAGKTAVAVYASLVAVANRKQVAILAPTEVLASQHLQKLTTYLSDSRVTIGYLAGSLTKRQRTIALQDIRTGKIDIVVGTHALLEQNVDFRDLGLVIIDEQHKFGVAQRAALSAKGKRPHTLVLTATPIPRSLAMTLFGDLDASVIEDAPPGRLPVVTTLVSEDLESRAWTFISQLIASGQQAYIVYPLVDESETLPLKAATIEVTRLAENHLAGAKVGLLHGRMKPAEKAQVMAQFRSGELHALVATTVIEVGVDVPNATLMVIQHAERYGLSQLHQLRGRIGRGNQKLYCLLFSDSTNPKSIERLNILCQSTDGFHIAEQDLLMRGPGELLGTRQHGIPTFKAADLNRDIHLLQQARDDAAEILRNDPEFYNSQHRELKRELNRRYATSQSLMRVG